MCLCVFLSDLKSPSTAHIFPPPTPSLSCQKPLHAFSGGWGGGRGETPPIFALNESLGFHGKMREGNVSHGYVTEIKLKEAYKRQNV